MLFLSHSPDLFFNNQSLLIFLLGKGNIERIDGIVYSAATAESDRKTNMVSTFSQNCQIFSLM